jgi:hypothetical protein
MEHTPVELKAMLMSYFLFYRFMARQDRQHRASIVILKLKKAISVTGRGGL